MRSLCSAVPINPDSMTYHLARVAHWAQNGSVAFYPTHIVRQLYQPPWAEFAVLHLFIFAGGDRLVNLVQWVSMVASLMGVSAIARQLGAGWRGQLLSAFACATIPMGILQSRTPQNDYAAALWLVCLVSALLAMDSRPGALPTLGAGASLGLALLTKGTSYVFTAPFVLVFVLTGRNRPLSKKLTQGLVIGLCAVALNAPQYWRNAQRVRVTAGSRGRGQLSLRERRLLARHPGLQRPAEPRGARRYAVAGRQCPASSGPLPSCTRVSALRSTTRAARGWARGSR